MIDIRSRRLPANRMLVARCASTDTESQFHEIQLPDGVAQGDFEDGVAAWVGGELIQNALGFLHSADREFLMTGITPERWNDLFGADDEDWNTEPNDA
ncbi:MAG: hypothetical protein HOE14_11955 [Gemmatimonadales bacterium]|jgi:hypothetical protein|nr:hypothetical protein [Gemmatimonadales bacterium]